MGNCLKTQLKEVVQNDNLPILGKVKITGTLSTQTSGNSIAFYPLVPASSIEVLSSDCSACVPYDNPEYNNSYISVGGTAGNSFTILVPKYDINQIVINNYQVEYNYTNLIEFTGLKSLIIGGYWKPSMQNVSAFEGTNLETLILEETNASGNLSSISKINSLKVLKITSNSQLQGDLSVIKDMPNLEEVYIVGTYITDTNNTVTYLQNRGVTVTYSS